MQENQPPIPQPPPLPMDQHDPSERDSSPVIIVPSPRNSPSNGHPTITGTGSSSITATVKAGPTIDSSSGGGNVSDLPAQVGYPLHTVSSTESISEVTSYVVPVKYRSSVGSFEEHVSCGFANLFATSELSDVTIACEGKLLKAHKLVLALSSSYFRQIFEELHDFPCQHPVVILHGVKLRDWENIMRLIYTGIVNISSNTIDDFISTAECLKIDGILCDEPSSSLDDECTPYEYSSNRFSRADYQEEDSTSAQYDRSSDPKRSYSSYSPAGRFTTAKDYSYEGNSPHDPNSQETETAHSVQFRSRVGQGSGSSRIVISSTQSSPGIGSASLIRERDPVIVPENLLKIETLDGQFSHHSDSALDVDKSSDAEGYRNYSHPPSPMESRIQAVRHPVISRRRDISSERTSMEDNFEHLGRSSVEYIPSSRMVMGPRYSRPSAYSVGWECRNLDTVGEPQTMEESDRPFPTVINSPRSPITTGIGSTGHGVTTKYPLSVISRQPHSANPFLSPGSSLIHRMPQLQLLSPSSRTPFGESALLSGGVITSVASPHSSPTGSESGGTLAMLRAKAAAGQTIYTRGYRHDRHQQHPSHFRMAGVPSAALGSAPQQREEMKVQGASGSQMFHGGILGSHQHQQIARPKTKAIRSSQVPQSARYTAAEVDAMVDKVQNFPGNMVPCTICQKFVKRERLRAHIHECHLLHGKRIVCPHCGIGLKSKGSYRVHIWRHKRGALPTTRQHMQQQQRLRETDDEHQSSLHGS